MGRLRAWPGRVLAATCLLCALAVAVLVHAAWMWTHAEHNERMREARFDFTHREVKDALESSLQLGLSLPNLPTAQDQLEAAFKQHTDIVSLDVVDASGQILFSTDASGIGARVPSAWLSACVANTGAAATAQGPAEALTRWRCVPVLDGIAQVTGAVLLRHRTLDAQAAGEGLPWGWLGGALGLALWAAWLAKRAAQAVDAQLLALAQSAAPEAAEGAAPEPDWAAGQAALRQLRAELSAIEAQVNELDAAEVG